MRTDDDIVAYNRVAWDQQVTSGSRWSLPVDDGVIERARAGDWELVLTPQVPVPRDWFGVIDDAQVLCLAGAGGQQAPILAAAGAHVTVLDNSPSQLQQDQKVAARHRLNLATALGDMADLSQFADDSFDLIVNPCSNGFVPDLKPVWAECHRVLRDGHRLMSGFINPLYFIFDYREMRAGKLVVRHAIPYADHRDLPPDQLRELQEAKEPLLFGHTLEDQIGGQLAAGFRLLGFYEDQWDSPDGELVSKYISTFAVTLAEKQTRK